MPLACLSTQDDDIRFSNTRKTVVRMTNWIIAIEATIMSITFLELTLPPVPDISPGNRIDCAGKDTWVKIPVMTLIIFQKKIISA